MPPGLTSPAHLLVILIVGLIVLGPDRLPQAVRQAGRAFAQARQVYQSLTADVRDAVNINLSDVRDTTEPTARPNDEPRTLPPPTTH